MNYQTIQQNMLVSTYPNRGITITRGDGVYLYDEHGERYLDMIGGYGVNILGYGTKEVTDEIHSQLDKIITLHSSFNNDSRSQATLSLLKMIRASGFSHLKRVFWSNSGAEAIEAAVKFAILKTNKTKFVAAKNGYHGKTLGALALNNSGNGKYQKPFKNVLLNVDLVEYGNLLSLNNVISSDHAAVILEPIQGEGGVIIPSPDYLSQVSKLCRAQGVLLIIDEIQTGVGRTGTFLNSERYVEAGFQPDIICMGKGLGYGLPVGATIITEEINSSLDNGIHTNTFGGNPLTMAAVHATLSYFQNHPDLFQQVQENGNYFITQLQKLQSYFPRIITEVSGEGFMIGVELSIDPVQVLRSLQQEKIIAAPTSTNRIRFLPPLVIGKVHIDSVVNTLKQIISK